MIEESVFESAETLREHMMNLRRKAGPLGGSISDSAFGYNLIDIELQRICDCVPLTPEYLRAILHFLSSQFDSDASLPGLIEFEFGNVVVSIYGDYDKFGDLNKIIMTVRGADGKIYFKKRAIKDHKGPYILDEPYEFRTQYWVSHKFLRNLISKAQRDQEKTKRCATR